MNQPDLVPAFPPTLGNRPGAGFSSASGAFLQALDRGPIILDAAMGTRLIDLGLDIRSEDPCLWNLTRPDEVVNLHTRDVAAGSRALFTNSFGANRLWLARQGRANLVEKINRNAVELALKSIGSNGFVIGDIGPTAADEPGATSEQAAVLIQSGVHAIILETYRSEPLMRAIHEIRTHLGMPVPILASLWEWPVSLADTAKRLVDLGVTAIGINCQPDLEFVIKIASHLKKTVGCPILVKPSVLSEGTPHSGSSPMAFAEAVPRLLACNVRMLGGCCGTTEAHISAIANACSTELNQPRTVPIGVPS